MRPLELAIAIAIALLPARGTADPQGIASPAHVPLRASAETSSGIRVLAMRTGWSPSRNHTGAIAHPRFSSCRESFSAAGGTNGSPTCPTPSFRETT